MAEWPSVIPLTLNGDATQAGQFIRITNQSSSQNGSAFTAEKVLSHKKSFKTEFGFWLNNGGPSPGEGLAFVVHPKADTTLGEAGGGLGYGGIKNSLAVEFDTTDNGDSDDANEVAIVVDGRVAKRKGSGIPAFPLHDADRFAWVSYSAKSHKVKAFVAETSEKPASPIATAKVNLQKVLGGKARAGFTATTSGDTASQFMQTWTLNQ